MRTQREVDVFLHMTYDRNDTHTNNRMLAVRVHDHVTGAEIEGYDEDLLLTEIARHNEHLSYHALTQRPVPGTPSTKRVGVCTIYCYVQGNAERWTANVFVLATTSQHAALAIYDTFRELWIALPQFEVAGYIILDSDLHEIHSNGCITPSGRSLQDAFNAGELFFEVGFDHALGISHFADLIQGDSDMLPVYCLEQERAALAAAIEAYEADEQVYKSGDWRDYDDDNPKDYYDQD